MNERSVARKASGIRLASGLLLPCLLLLLCGCGNVIYPKTTYNYSGRATPPSGLQQRVLVAYTANGTSGGLQLVDGLRDLRGNVQNTIYSYPVSGFSAAQPTQIINFPEQQRGYVLSYTDGALGNIDYSKEASSGSAGSFGAFTPSVAAAPTGIRFAGASETAGLLTYSDSGVSYGLNLPNVYRVAINAGSNVVLAMVRNSNALYRIVKLPQTNNPVTPPGAVDCQPLLLPQFCVVPVGGTFDRPTGVTFSTDGSYAYVLNCGPECAGGKTAGVSVLSLTALDMNNVPTTAAPNAMATLPVANPVPVPGGVTAGLSDGTTLYLAGQSLFRLTSSGALGTTPATDGLFTGFVTAVPLSTFVPAAPLSISDGTHTRMLFADDSTLWIGSQQCANGERAATGQNYNCLTRVALSSGGGTAATLVVPDVTPGGVTTVPYRNADGNAYYYGSLNGLCWVQGYHKIYTAYGGQLHVFQTTPGSLEIYNGNVTVNGTVLDVAYMDALTNSAN